MKKSNNSNLSAAKAAKNDEFYTRLYDIEMELKHYKDQFKGKVVYCNCDDCFESNFFKYFALNFNQLGLKKLITTCYAESKVGKQFRLFDEEGEPQKKAYKLVINEIPDMNGDGAIDLTDVELLIKSDKNVLTVLNGDGDFRSEECVELLKEADIVVSNPPFSLFREYVALLVEYGKQFLIIGNKNAITYKEIFPIIKENNLWLGYCSPNEYILPNGEVTKQVNGLCRWFTNLPTEKRNKPLDLYKTYNPEEYPKYDNYDAIEVSKVADIPMDYDGVMGVPITFLDKYCPTQFEIVDARCVALNEKQKVKNTMLIKDADGTINQKSTYARICIKRV